MHEHIVAVLRCPRTGQALTYHEGAAPYLQTQDGRYRYPVSNGIAMLLPDHAQAQSSASAAHE